MLSKSIHVVAMAKLINCAFKEQCFNFSALDICYCTFITYSSWGGSINLCEICYKYAQHGGRSAKEKGLSGLSSKSPCCRRLAGRLWTKQRLEGEGVASDKKMHDDLRIP